MVKSSQCGKMAKLFLFYEGVVCNFKVFKKDLSNIQYFFTVQVLTVDYISVKTAAVV